MALKDFLQLYGQTEKDLPGIVGAYAGKKLIVCGDAQCVWRDLEMFGAKCTKGRGSVARDGYDIMTINKLIEVMPANVEHIWSNEPSKLAKWVQARRDEYTREFERFKCSHSCNDGAMYRWPFGGHGTSALGATLAGCLMYDEVVLCGVPLSDGPHNGEPHWRKTAFESSEAAGDVNTGEDGHWKNARKLVFNGKVTSMPGRTRKWLGAPGE